MTRFLKFFKSDAAYHILIWALLIGPHAFFSATLLERDLYLYLINLIIQDGLLIVITYLNVYYLIPKFYVAKKYIIYFAILLALFILYINSTVGLERYISGQLNSEESDFFRFFFNLFNISRYTVIAFLLFSIREKAEQKKKLDRIEVEKLHAELNYLRAQIHPHFLFNTLNNLYGLALEKSEKTPEVILRLSKMMDYMLYELDDNRVPLKRDLENLGNYIDLERIRQGNNASIQYTVHGTISDQTIEPLLLLPLVENAFKHGVNQMIEGAFLVVEVSVEPYSLSFHVKNNYKEKPTTRDTNHSGIGLINLTKRLDMLYPGKHELLITDRSTIYEVSLTLTFA